MAAGFFCEEKHPGVLNAFFGGKVQAGKDILWGDLIKSDACFLKKYFDLFYLNIIPGNVIPYPFFK